MTAICAISDKTGVYIGGDSAGVAGLDIVIRSDEKVFHNGSFIIGGTTSFRMLQLLRYKFKPPKQADGQDDMEYMVVDFIDAARKCFADSGYGKEKPDRGGSFLVGYNGKLYSIDDDFQVGIPTRQYDACGCGRPYSLGSLKETVKDKPEVRIKKALAAAEMYSAGVAGPFHIVKQLKNNKKA